MATLGIFSPQNPVTVQRSSCRWQLLEWCTWLRALAGDPWCLRQHAPCASRCPTVCQSPTGIRPLCFSDWTHSMQQFIETFLLKYHSKSNFKTMLIFVTNKTNYKREWTTIQNKLQYFTKFWPTWTNKWQKHCPGKKNWETLRMSCKLLVYHWVSNNVTIFFWLQLGNLALYHFLLTKLLENVTYHTATVLLTAETINYSVMLIIN